MGSRRASALRLLAALLLAALAAAIVGPLVHTDDGCAVEQHCTACRTALASVGAAPPAAPQLAASSLAGSVSPEDPATHRDAPVASAPSRGPPAVL